MELIKTEFDSYLIDQIQHLIERRDHCELVREDSGPYTSIHHHIWLYTPERTTELRLCADCRRRVTISRVRIQHTHERIFTDVFKLLWDWCVTVGIREIRIESVLTDEMRAWCEANKFEPCIHSGAVMDYKFYGDYVRRIDSGVASDS